MKGVQMSEQNFYNMKVTEVFKELNTSETGLPPEEAKKRLDQYGRNELSGIESTSKLKLFLNQFKDVLVILLLVAAAMSIMIGSYFDGGVMLTIALINSTIGFFQEFKAEKIMESLNNLIKSPAKVIRNKKLSEVDQGTLVVGDIVSLEEGDKIPADLRLIETFNLRMVEVSLTGESMPQEKHTTI